MFKLRIKQSFSAAHFIPGYPHECRHMHGHNFLVEAFICGEKLNELGMVIDFKEFKKALKLILSEFDHQLLNDSPEFKEKPPTSEILSQLIHTRLSDFMQANHPQCSVSGIRVWESENCYVEYST